MTELASAQGSLPLSLICIYNTGLSINAPGYEAGLLTCNYNLIPSVFKSSNLRATADAGYEVMQLRQYYKSHDYVTDFCSSFSDLESPTQSLKALLLKYARCSSDGAGNKVYNSKRPLN